MQRYTRLKAELEQLRYAAEKLGAASNASHVVIYDAGPLSGLPEEEREARLKELVVEKQAEQKAAPVLRGSKTRKQQKEEARALLLIPEKGSFIGSIGEI